MYRLTLASSRFTVKTMLNGTNGQAHTTNTQVSDAAEEPRGHSVGLTQAYQFRLFAFETAVAVMAATDEALKTEATRARALRDAKDVWQAAQDESRVCRGVGKPKSVTAANDPSRKASKPRTPRGPLGPSLPPTEPGTSA
jgi:hypothetical protein